MSESICPINPYLATIIQNMKAQVPEEQLREEYQQSGRKLSWLEFLGENALSKVMVDNPVLRMRRAAIPLPETILDGLYWLRVDVVADLLQISEEELRSFEKQENLDVDMIEDFLIKNGLKLYHGTRNSWKIPALRIIDPDRACLWEQWDMASLERHKINPARPALVQEWFDEHYKRQEYIPGEENLADEWLNIKPELEDGDTPSDLEEFFEDTHLFFDAYEGLCKDEGIKRVVETPTIPCLPEELKLFPNDRFLSIKKDMVKAVISVLENTNLLGMPTYRFLGATDERKLQLIEPITHSQNFQLFLIQYVALRVDFESVLDYFNARSISVKTPKKDDKGVQPINPWLAELILKYRKQHSDEFIREGYRQFCEHTPDKSWEDYLAERALLEESKCNPIILADLDKSSLPEGIKNYLFYNCAVDIMADLLQITAEELNTLFEERLLDIPAIEQYLDKWGQHLYHCDKYTYKIPFPEE